MAAGLLSLWGSLGFQTFTRLCKSQGIAVLELRVHCERARHAELDADVAQLGFLEGIASDHKYREKPRAEGARPRPRTVRLGKEIAGLSADLPLSPTSSVFVRVDEQNATLWRALITGSSLGPQLSRKLGGSQYPDHPISKASWQQWLQHHAIHALATDCGHHCRSSSSFLTLNNRRVVLTGH